MNAKILVTGFAIKKSLSLVTRGQVTAAASAKTGSVRSYEEIPGPKPFPVLGNAWRFLPKIGTKYFLTQRKFESNNIIINEKQAIDHLRKWSPPDPSGNLGTI